MTSSQSIRRRVSFQPEVRVHIVTRTPSPELIQGQHMRLAADGAWQAGANSISTLNNGAPHFIQDGPQMQTAYPSFFVPTIPTIPPTPFLRPVELPPTPPTPLQTLGELGLAQLSLPTGTSSILPTLGPEPVHTTDAAPIIPTGRGGQPPIIPPPLALPIVWQLGQQWDVRACGLPLTLPAAEPIPALSGVPTIILHFAPHELFAPFAYALAVPHNHEDKFVVTVDDLARAVLDALHASREPASTTDAQRAVLAEAQRWRRREHPLVDRRLDMWGPGEMYLRHLESLTAAGGARREFVVRLQLVVRGH